MPLYLMRGTILLSPPLLSKLIRTAQPPLYAINQSLPPTAHPLPPAGSVDLTCKDKNKPKTAEAKQQQLNVVA